MLLRAFATGKIASTEIAPALARCLLCGRCERVCPSQIPLERIFFAARFILSGLLPVSRKIRSLARLLCSSPGTLDFLQPPVHFITKYLDRKSASEKLFLPAPRPFARKSTDKSGGVLLFSGCIARRIFPHVASAAVSALELNGLTVLTPQELLCCGRPLAIQGDRKGLLKAIRLNLKLLAAFEFEWLTSPCPGCLRTMREIWLEMDGLTGTEREQLSGMLGRVIDLNTLLAQNELASGSRNTEIYWHRPCLLDEAACQSAMRLLGSAPAQKEPPICCGAPLQCLELKSESASTSNMLAPERRAPALAERLAEHLRSRAAGAECIVTACPGCMLSLGRYAPVPVRHLVELLASRATRI